MRESRPTRMTEVLVSLLLETAVADSAPGRLAAHDDAAGHAVAGAGFGAVGVGLGVNDDG